VTAKTKSRKQKPRVAFIVQRCGKEVNGGAESLCLQVAQRMSNVWDTEILTTCALDYMTWENHFPEGAEKCGDTTIRRFPNSDIRDIEAFNEFSIELHQRIQLCSMEEQQQWMKMQGPNSNALSTYIETHKNDFTAFIFFGYLYATTVHNLPKVADKSYLVPCAHDEWPIYFSMFDRFFALPKKLVFNMDSEKAFLEQRFFHLKMDGPTAGIGIDLPDTTNPEVFIQKFKITTPYLLYCGRIDPSKGCTELIEAFLLWKLRNSLPHQLVLVGNPAMEIPEHDDIIATGFVTLQEKWNAMAGCDWLMMPSKYESLSMVLLEAWSIGKPALVNKQCDVLVEHCEVGKGGLSYESWDEALDIITQLPHTEYAKLATQGQKYVQEKYNWPIICEKFKALLL
jgi:glycosyltransferase involved in cell wall biosynthesis